MPDTPDSTAPVTAAAFRVLLEQAGLSVSEARAPMVLEELNAQLALTRTLDPVPDTPDSTAPVNAETFRALLEQAGLSVSEERAPMVLEELNAQLALARALPPLPDGKSESERGPFDPTFPKIAREDDAE